MQELKPSTGSESQKCPKHNTPMGPEGCTICMFFDKPKAEPDLRALEPAVDWRTVLIEFLRLHGMKSLGLLLVGSVTVFAFAWPRVSTIPKPIDAAPYQQAIVDMESVLFYPGPTDSESQLPILTSLVESLTTAVKAKPPAERSDDLIDALDGLSTSVRNADPSGFRMTAPRKRWVEAREKFFDDAVWFRLRDDKLDAMQNRAANEPAPVDLGPASLEMLDVYYRSVERFVARAGNISARACSEGGDKDGLTSEFRSLAADARAEVDAIFGTGEQSLPAMNVVRESARSLMRWRNGGACGTGVPDAIVLESEFASFRRTVESTRSRLTGGS